MPLGNPPCAASYLHHHFGCGPNLPARHCRWEMSHQYPLFQCLLRSSTSSSTAMPKYARFYIEGSHTWLKERFVRSASAFCCAEKAAASLAKSDSCCFSPCRWETKSSFAYREVHRLHSFCKCPHLDYPEAICPGKRTKGRIHQQDRGPGILSVHVKKQVLEDMRLQAQLRGILVSEFAYLEKPSRCRRVSGLKFLESRFKISQKLGSFLFPLLRELSYLLLRYLEPAIAVGSLTLSLHSSDVLLCGQEVSVLKNQIYVEFSVPDSVL